VLSARGSAQAPSSPDDLKSAALQSVLKWHYSPETGRSVQISIRFDAVPNLAGNAPLLQAIIKTIQVTGVSPELERQVLAAIPVHEGDQAGPDTMPRVIAAAQTIDEHFMGRMDVNGKREATVMLKLQPGVVQNPAPEGIMNPPENPVTAGPRRLRMGGNIAQNNLITRVVPIYPAAAKQARLQGVVRFEAVIGTDGKIEKLKVISGEPMLADAAADAVKQWVYRPTLLNGSPVAVATEIDVNFTLSK